MRRCQNCKIRLTDNVSLICDMCYKDRGSKRECPQIEPGIESQLYGAFARMDAKKSKRGGARKGTGPKHGPGGKRIKRNIALTADVWAYLVRDGLTAGTAIETRIRSSKEFKSWTRSNG